MVLLENEKKKNVGCGPISLNDESVEEAHLSKVKSGWNLSRRPFRAATHFGQKNEDALVFRIHAQPDIVRTASGRWCAYTLT